MDTALRTLIGVVRGPSMMIAGLAAATAVAGALAYAVSTIRSAGAAEARLDELARISVENGELADAQRAAAADARASEAGIGLFMRLRRLEARQDVDDERNASLDRAVAELNGMRAELHSLHVEVAGKYVTRKEWIPSQSRILGALERQGEALARLEGKLETANEYRL